MLVTRGPLGGESLFGAMQMPLHLLVLLFVLLWLLALRLPRRFARKRPLAFGLVCPLASHVVSGCPRVVGEIGNRGRRRVYGSGYAPRGIHR